MASIVVEFGRARTERRSLSLTRADKDRILQNFPEQRDRVQAPCCCARAEIEQAVDADK
jgi:hypothetical protein